MNLRIIAGYLGGQIIEGSSTKRTHPMSERIRGSLFNIIQDEIRGARVLDAFAGSGALGIEAMSRGASSATFIERDRVAQGVISRNITKLGLDDRTQLIKASVARWLETTDQQYDVILSDPPYHDEQLSTVMKLIKVLKPNGLMVLSYTGKGEVPTELGVVVVDNRSYGDAVLTFYRRRSS